MDCFTCRPQARIAGKGSHVRLSMDFEAVAFNLPPVNSAQDAAATVSAVLAAVAIGEITPADAGEISKLIEAYVRAFETAELADRLERLERMTSQ